MEKVGVVICQPCAHDLAESLTPKPETIPVSQPTVTPVREVHHADRRKAYGAGHQEEMYRLLWDEAMRQGH